MGWSLEAHVPPQSHQQHTKRRRPSTPANRSVSGAATEAAAAAAPTAGSTAVLCVGGDGTLHEVLQGLLSRPDWRQACRLPLALLPAGSGNAVAYSAGLWDAAAVVHAVVKGSARDLDVATVVQPRTGLIRHSFLSLTYGSIASIDIGSERMRFLGGARFAVQASSAHLFPLGDPSVLNIPAGLALAAPVLMTAAVLRRPSRSC